LIIGKFYSSHDLGIYNRAYKLLGLTLNLVSGLFGTVLYPSLKKHRTEGGDFKPEYDSILGIISLINFPIVAVLILIPEFTVRLLWGENWMMVAAFLPYFGILIITQALMSTTGQIYLLLEKERTMMIVGVASDVVRVIAIVTGSMFSITGIVIGLVVSNLVINLPLNLYVGFYRTFEYSFLKIAKFWISKMIFSLLFFILVFLEKELWLVGLMIAYLFHLLFYQRHDLKQLNGVIKNFRRNRK
jgi:O-antigen/teichoic acid export membrane protein